MTHEAVILESRTMRDSLTEWTQALDRVKALQLLPDGVHLTTRLVADYFEVGETAIYNMVTDHRDELEASGYRVLEGEELTRFKRVSGMPSRTRALALFPRRAVLNVAMLLRDSDVARQVRSQLLDLADAARPSAALDAYVAELARRVAEEVVLRRLQPHARVVGAMSCRLADVDTALREVRGRMDSLCTLWAHRSVQDRSRGRRCR
ncbi:restriction endonuclease [Peterkaempfera bronchialis]|uniref:restriction endonuclease n=1 Tax=Peterkaempfera bronchialis TaxID=2126346 RepID=UPI003C2AC4FD